jgi:hypothetical protein
LNEFEGQVHKFCAVDVGGHTQTQLDLCHVLIGHEEWGARALPPLSRAPPAIEDHNDASSKDSSTNNVSCAQTRGQ